MNNITSFTVSTDTCNICSTAFKVSIKDKNNINVKKFKKCSFYSQLLHNKSLTVMESLKAVFRIDFDSLPPDEKEKLYIAGICQACACKVGQMHRSIEDIKKVSMKPNSLISCLMLQKSTQQLPPAKLHRLTQTIKPPKQESPVAKMMADAVKDPSRCKTFQNTIRKMIRNELKKYVKISSFRESNDFQLPKFDEIEKELEKECPLLLTIIDALGNKSGSVVVFNDYMMTILGVSLYAHSDNCNLFQKSMGLNLWKAKASKMMYLFFNKIGISTSYKTIHVMLDNAKDENLKKVQQWKQDAEKFLNFSKSTDNGDKDKNDKSQTHDVEEDHVLTLFSSPDAGSLKRKNNAEETKLEDAKRIKLSTNSNSASNPLTDEITSHGGEELDESLFKGVTLTMDIFNREVKRRVFCPNTPNTTSESTANKGTLSSGVSAAFIFNRIHLPREEFFLIKHQNNEIPLSAFMLKESDVISIKKDHLITIKSILVSDMDIFTGILDPTEKYYAHKYTVASSSKSEIISLGIIQEDPNTAEGMTNVFKNLESYLPKKGEETHSIVCWGRDLNRKTLIKPNKLEKRCSKKQHKISSTSDLGEFQSLYPALSHHHKRILLLNEDAKLLMKPDENESETTAKNEFGSLPSLKTEYGFALASTNVKHRFNATFKFLSFCLKSYVVALANFYLANDDNYKKDFSKLIYKERLDICNSLTQKILQFCWIDFSKALHKKGFCICKSENDVEKEKTSELIRCDLPTCTKFSLYHKKCLVSSSDFNKPPPKSAKKWFCSKDCETESLDKVVQYTKAIMLAGLNHESFKRAIRYNNGDKIESFNKLHLILMFNQNHLESLRAFHRNQALINGLAPPHIKFDLKHNSTVNIGGGTNKNYPIDLYHEFLTKSLKDSVVTGILSQTERSIERRGQSGGMSTEVSAELLSFVLEEEPPPKGSLKYKKWSGDIKNCAERLVTENVFTPSPEPRFHSGFSNFEYKYIHPLDLVPFHESIKKLTAQINI